ncbi:MAG TPA: hypothetical protein VGC41_09530 [Kofleriaceae bacterium]
MKYLAFSLLVACSNGPGTEEAQSPSCVDAMTHSDLAWIQTNVFDKSCAVSGCHDARGHSGQLILTDGNSHANLVAKAAVNPGTDGWKRVTAGDPSASYLMVALGQEAGPMPTDGFMPLQAEALCQAKIDAVSRWITAGAAE